MKKAFHRFLEHITRYNQVVNAYGRAKDASPDHAIAHVNWGIEIAQDGRIEDALEKFSQAADIAPHRYEPFLNWGVALARLNRLDEASDKFKLATERDPKAAGAYTLWGAVLLEQGQPEAAQEKYEQAITLSPENPEPYANWGISLARTGAYPQAIEKFKQSLTIYGYQPQLYFMWGAILAESQDYEAAIEKFRITLRLLPKHAEAYYFWSLALNHLGRYEEALEKSKRALSLDLEKPEVYLNQGDILANLNRLDVAISNYQHAVTLEPGLPDAYLGWGVALCRQKNYEAGYAKFQKCLELQPDCQNLHHQWGQFLLEQDRYEEALSHLRRGAEAHPANITILLNLTMALLKTGRIDEGVQQLFEIETLDRWNPQAHYLLGTHFLSENNLVKAQEHLEKALEAKPDFEDAAVNLAVVYCEMDNTLDAVRRLRPIIRRMPDSARINFYYGTMLYRHGDNKDAIAKYQKAIALDPNYLEPRIGLAEVHLRQGNLEETSALLQAVLHINPHSVPALFLQGVLALRQSDAAKSEDTRQHWNQSALQSFEAVTAIDPTHLDSWANIALLQGRMHSIEAMNQAFESLLADNSPDLKALILYYWSKALEQLGESEAALAKMQEACHENPLLAEHMQSRLI